MLGGLGRGLLMNGNLMFCESAYGSLEELQVLGFVFLEHWLFAYIWQEMTLEGKTGTTKSCVS